MFPTIELIEFLNLYSFLHLIPPIFDCRFGPTNIMFLTESSTQNPASKHPYSSVDFALNFNTE